MKEVNINASGKKLGRLASELAILLRGKNESDFERHVLPSVKVTVTNAGEISTTDRKLAGMEHKRYSGYPGGLKILTGRQVVAKKGKRELLKKAVYGMLPKNTHRSKIIKNLIITE